MKSGDAYLPLPADDELLQLVGGEDHRVLVVLGVEPLVLQAGLGGHPMSGREGMGFLIYLTALFLFKM